MANAGPDTNRSQFFIMHADYPLPPNYTIFGRVTEGQEVVDAIACVARDRSDKPVEVAPGILPPATLAHPCAAPVVMEKVTIAS